MRAQSWTWWVFMLLCTGTVGYALVAYAFLPAGVTVHPEMRAVYREHPAPILAHVFGASAALLLGPWQFSASLRARRPMWHRMMGRAYLLAGVGVGGAGGLWMAFLAYGGWVSMSGFAALAVLWMLTGGLALRAALRRDFAAHRAWMVRNMSLTFAAVTLRAGLGAGFGLGLRFDTFYPALAWASWVFNLIAAEWIVRRGR